MTYTSIHKWKTSFSTKKTNNLEEVMPIAIEGTIPVFSLKNVELVEREAASINLRKTFKAINQVTILCSLHPGNLR